MITGAESLRRRGRLRRRRREALRALKSFLAPKSAADTTVVDVRLDVQRVVLEYILNMAVSCLAHADVTPLYEQYIEDPRLSEQDREELARAYLLLQMATVEPEPAPSADA